MERAVDSATEAVRELTVTDRSLLAVTGGVEQSLCEAAKPLRFHVHTLSQNLLIVMKV
jgi:hypothetical protein